MFKDIMKRNELKKAMSMRGIDYETIKLILKDFDERVKSIPTSEKDFVEVVHGRWLQNEPETIYCSECNYSVWSYYNTLYCSNCGAKIDGEKKDVSKMGEKETGD